jgi:hypothetical protein
MLEVREDLIDVGKSYIARSLLEYEGRARTSTDEGKGAWYRTLWSIFAKNSIDEFRSTPLTIITFNYDRSIEHALVSSLKSRFKGATDEDCARALDAVGPIHLHGRLGGFPGFGAGDSNVSYGGDNDGITDDEVIKASNEIQIIHEANPQGEAFVKARDAIAKANRVIFLGFSYARQNVERLRLTDCMHPSTDVYLCATGFTQQQQSHLLRPMFAQWNSTVRFGQDNEDIVEFFRHYPDALL